MAEILRLKSYRDYGLDGRSYIECKSTNKSMVLVAVVVGVEPLVMKDGKDECRVDDVILDMAKHIIRNRKSRTRKKGSSK